MMTLALSVSKLGFVAFAILLLASSSLVTVTIAESGQDGATSALKNAEVSVASTYQTVLELEKLGANVSDSLSQLNDAAGYLAHAHVALSLGDFDEAIGLANLAYNASNAIKGKTDELLHEVSRAEGTAALLRISGSILGIAVLGIASFFAWRAFGRRYRKRILGMKPEVVQNES